MANPLKRLTRLFGSKKAPAAPDAAPAETAGSVVTLPAPPEPAHPEPPRRRRSAKQVLKEGVVRVHAAGVLVLVSWAGYLAVSYLIQTVFTQTPVPERLVTWQGRSDAAALRAGSAAGLTTYAERAPIEHYHRVRPWFQPDLRNGCTVGGCHDPLPHTKEMKVPAFANFHATFLSCQMCHAPADAGAVAWVDIGSGQRQQTPAMVRLLNYLEGGREPIKAKPAEAHATIVPLLREALAVLGDDPPLQALLLQLETSEPQSPVWRRAVERLMAELPWYARGEYGAKIAREKQAGDYARGSRRMVELAGQYLANHSDTARRKELHQEIHGSLLKEPVTCLSCHGDSPGAVDYTALGYSQKRSRLLGNLQLARLMQQIRQGEQFHIPRFLEAEDGR